MTPLQNQLLQLRLAAKELEAEEKAMREAMPESKQQWAWLMWRAGRGPFPGFAVRPLHPNIAGLGLTEPHTNFLFR